MEGGVINYPKSVEWISLKLKPALAFSIKSSQLLWVACLRLHHCLLRCFPDTRCGLTSQQTTNQTKRKQGLWVSHDDVLIAPTNQVMCVQEGARSLREMTLPHQEEMEMYRDVLIVRWREAASRRLPNKLVTLSPLIKL